MIKMRWALVVILLSSAGAGDLYAQASPPAAAAAVSLPGNSDLDLILVTPFSERMGITQALTFKTARELKKDGAVLVPKDASVAGRVTRVLKQSSYVRGTKRNYYIVGLQLLSIDIGDKSTPLTANLETVAPSAMNDYFAPLSHGPDKWGEFEQYKFQFKVPDPQPGESFLGVVREGLTLPKGLRLVFRTPQS